EPVSALVDPGGARSGLCPHRSRQGAAGADSHDPARAPQCPDSVPDRGRNRYSALSDRRGGHGNGLLLAGHGPALFRFLGQTRLPGADGSPPPGRGPDRAWQPRCRCALCRTRSPDLPEVSAAETTLAALDPRSMQQVQTKPMSPWRIVWRRLRRSRSALLGTVIFGLVVVLSAFAGLIAPYG